jgi:hypothetical protein
LPTMARWRRPAGWSRQVRRTGRWRTRIYTAGRKGVPGKYRASSLVNLRPCPGLLYRQRERLISGVTVADRLARCHEIAGKLHSFTFGDGSAARLVGSRQL